MKMKRMVSLILSLCLLFSLTSLTAGAQEFPSLSGETVVLPDISGDVSIYRYAGDDRFTTSLMAADAMRKALGVQKFDAVIIASGANFADALSGSYLAAAKKAPILLAYKDKQNAQVSAYIKSNLKPGGTVYILGGTSAVPKSMDSLLKGFNVQRLDGANRFETNLLILKAAGVKNKQEILVCTSTNFADSLSASATGLPILLVYNEKGKLTDSQKKFLSGLTDCTFRIIGGKSAVSEGLAAALKGYGSVARLAGNDRFSTSVAVAETFFKSPRQAVLAYAGNFPDGLCGGPLAYAMGAPLILTADRYANVAAEYTADAQITQGVILGGKSLISDKAAIKIFAQTDIPDPTDPPSTEPTPTVPPSTEPAPTTPPATEPAPTTPPSTEPEETIPPLDEKSVYEAMIAMKAEYPEGMSWTDNNRYSWNGGIYSSGTGCAGFAFLLSDAAFGTLPARVITPNPDDFYWVNPMLIEEDLFFSIDDIRVGDILRVNHNTHSVIVLEVHADHVVIAEGNYNYSIHWGRVLYDDDIMMVDYILTRYPAE